MSGSENLEGRLKPQKAGIDDESICIGCNSRHLVRDVEHGDLVCGDCGTVQNTKDFGLDFRPEPSYDSEQERNVRHSGPRQDIRRHESLTTEIDWRDKDSYGKGIPLRNRQEIYRLRKWQRRIKVANSMERNLVRALKNLELVMSQMQAPINVREAAAFIYRRAVDKKLTRGRHIESVVAASIYGAYRRCEIPRTLDEIAEAAVIDRKEIGRAYRFLQRELNLGPNRCTPKDYISRFCCELKLSREAQAKTMDILAQAEAMELISGRGPTGTAAAAIYIALKLLGETRTEKNVADIAGVTEVTIRNRYRELVEKLGITLPRAGRHAYSR